MGKRMKRVFGSHAEVAHVWASESQSDGRANNVFFDGNKIYSYGRHYVAAVIHTKVNKLALVNEYRYSSSTGKHRHRIVNALQGRMSYIYVPVPDASSNEDHKINLLYLENNVVSHLESFFNKTKYVYVQSLIETIDLYNQYGTFFNKNFKKFDLDDGTWAVIEEIARIKGARVKELKESREEKEELKRLKLAEEYRTEIELWPNNQNTKSIPYNLFPKDFDLVRVSKDFKEVETCRGAKVPLPHAVRLLQKTVNGKVRKGDKVGYFTVTKVSQKNLTIGCHVINIAQATDVINKAIAIISAFQGGGINL